MKSYLTVIGFFAAVLLLFAIVSSIFQSNKSQVQSEPEEKEEFKKNSGKVIPGIVAVDVYGNFTKLGFELDRSFDAEYGHLWTCKSEPFIVTVFGHSTDQIESVQATFQSIDGLSNEATEFFGFVASIPYDGSDQVKAKEWVLNNINNPGSTIIGSVRFTIFTPTKFARMLRIEGV